MDYYKKYIKYKTKYLNLTREINVKKMIGGGDVLEQYLVNKGIDLNNDIPNELFETLPLKEYKKYYVIKTWSHITTHTPFRLSEHETEILLSSIKTYFNNIQSDIPNVSLEQYLVANGIDLDNNVPNELLKNTTVPEITFREYYHIDTWESVNTYFNKLKESLSFSQYLIQKKISLNDNIPHNLLNGILINYKMHYNVIKWRDMTQPRLKQFNVTLSQNELNDIFTKIDTYFYDISSPSSKKLSPSSPSSKKLSPSSPSSPYMNSTVFSNLKPATSSTIKKFKDFYNYANKSLYSLAYKRIDKHLTPIPVNRIYFDITNDSPHFNMYALYNGLYKDELITTGLKYITDYNKHRISVQPWREEDLGRNINKLNTYEIEKNLFIGTCSGTIRDTEIYINRIDAGHLPRGGGNYIICLLVYYLQYLSGKYKNNTEFSIRLESEPGAQTAYSNMGFKLTNSYGEDQLPIYATNSKLFYEKCNTFNNDQPIEYIDNEMMNK